MYSTLVSRRDTNAFPPSVSFPVYRRTTVAYNHLNMVNISRYHCVVVTLLNTSYTNSLFPLCRRQRLYLSTTLNWFRAWMTAGTTAVCMQDQSFLRACHVCASPSCVQYSAVERLCRTSIYCMLFHVLLCSYVLS